MPPKRKSLPTETDDKARKAKMVKKMEPPKTWKETELSTKLESEYKEPIKYDEYMEGGIPDSLLEGLGFSESELPQDSGTGGADDDDETAGAESDLGSGAEILRGFDPSVLAAQGLTEAMSSYVVDQINAMAKSGLISATLPQQIVDLTLAASSKAMATAPSQVAQARKPVSASTSPLRVSRRLSARNSIPTDNTVTVDSSRSTSRLYAPTPVVRPLLPRMVLQPATGTRPPPVSLSVQPPRQTFPRSTRVYNTAPRTITKGNIVYERMPTGEVIASLIKKPTPDVSGRPNQTGDMSARGSSTTSLYRGVPTSSASPITFEDCPINEYNVGEVLEKSIKATQSMRMLLTSLRDDLRRIGAGTAMVTEEQVRKRQEVADKLTKAYATYKRSIEDIEQPQTPENARAATVTSAATHRTDKPTADVARPVMLVKHGIPVGAAANEHGNTRRGASATVTAPAAGRAQDRGEVIELSESDEDNEQNGPASRGSGEGNHRKEGSSRAASNSGGRHRSDGNRSAEVGKPNKEQSSHKDGQSNEASETKTAKIDSNDSKRKECNGVGGSANEKK